MDGTLINSGTLIANTINYVRENIKLTTMEKDIILEYINDPDINPAKFFYNTDDFTKEQTILFESYYNKNFYIDLELYSGIKELLNELNGSYFLFVATNANDYTAKKMLNHLNIEHYFSSIIGANNVQNPKPHPDMLLKLIDDHDLEKHRTILIGDSPKDKLSANNAGIESIIVNWGFTKYDDGAIHNCKELLNMLKKY